ncbi:MAG: hypothetical protein QM754_06065 [Tepidisphaeraceae bacterium]
MTTAHGRKTGRAGFGLLELLTSVAFLVILLGFAVSAARYVRSKDSAAAIRQQLAMLNGRLAAYGLPAELPIFAENLTAADEAAAPDRVLDQAKENADLCADWLRVDRTSMTDPWGTPIVAIPGKHRARHVAAVQAVLDDAGPDGRFFTLSDNIYGYDSYYVATPPASRPGGGHGE